MGIGGALLLAVGAVFVFTNVVTMRRLWASVLERRAFRELRSATPAPKANAQIALSIAAPSRR